MRHLKTFHIGFRKHIAVCCMIWVVPLSAGAQVESIPLSEALELALERNPSLAASGEHREASEARVRAARSGYFPQLSVVAGYTWYKEPNIIIPIHEIGVFPPLDDQIYTTDFQLKMPLFTGGRNAANTRAARASVEESNAQQNLVKFGVLEGIGRTFVHARQIEDSQRLVTARINSLRRRYREMALLLKEGRVSPAELALVKASVQSARADSIDIDRNKVELSHRLGQLLGLDRPVGPEIAGFDADRSGSGPEAFIFSDTSSSTGPLVAKARAQLVWAEATKGVISSSFWPEISAFGVYMYRSGADFNMIGEWAAGIALRFPLFEGGRRIADRHAADAMVRAAQERLKSAQLEQDANLEISLEQCKSARVQREYIERAVENKAQSIAAQQEMYRTGRVSLSDVLVQETELLQLQIKERALAAAEILALLNYHSTAGTLTSDKVQEIIRGLT